MAVVFNETRLEKVCLRILDHDNKPLDIRGAVAKGARRTVVFRSRQGEGLRLYYGNPEATPPVYDLAKLYPKVETSQPGLMILGPERLNASFRPRPEPAPPKEWGWLIWLILIPVALFLGYLVIRTVREIAEREG